MWNLSNVYLKVINAQVFECWNVDYLNHRFRSTTLCFYIISRYFQIFLDYYLFSSIYLLKALTGNLIYSGNHSPVSIFSFPFASISALPLTHLLLSANSAVFSSQPGKVEQF